MQISTYTIETPSPYTLLFAFWLTPSPSQNVRTFWMHPMYINKKNAKIYTFVQFVNIWFYFPMAWQTTPTWSCELLCENHPIWLFWHSRNPTLSLCHKIFSGNSRKFVKMHQEFLGFNIPFSFPPSLRASFHGIFDT